MVTLGDFVSSIFILVLAGVFTIIAFVWRGIFWFGLLSGLLWIVYGFTCMAVTTEVYMYQRTLAIVWFVIGIGMLFTPIWFRRKQKSMGEEMDEVDDTDEFAREMREQRREIARYRGLGIKKKREY